MFLKEIDLKNFRNFEDVKVRFNRNFNIFYGNNGQGKTNFLEAVYLIAGRKSFRKTENLINYNKDRADVAAEIELNGIDYSLSLRIEKDKRIYTINGKKEKKKLPLNIYLINSDVLFYFKNFSFYRRRFIDRLCYNVYGKNFLHVYNMWIKGKANFRKAVENNQLKEKAILFEMVQRYKREVDIFRRRLIDDLKKEYEELRKFVGLEDIWIRIIRDRRDDINFYRRDKRDLSLGELKSMLFVIFIATVKMLKDRNNIMLIDDFYSEWDNKKADNIVQTLKKTDIQSFIMTNQNEHLADFRIEKGAVYNI